MKKVMVLTLIGALLCAAAAVGGARHSRQRQANPVGTIDTTTTPSAPSSPAMTPTTRTTAGSTHPVSPVSSQPDQDSDTDDDSADEGIPPGSATAATPRERALWAASSRAAVEFVSAFARRPGDTPALWWARVQNRLTPQAQASYAAPSALLPQVDPATVPFTKVTGPAQVHPWADPQAAADDLAVAVPTDAGVVVVHVVPSTSPATAKVSLLDFPSGP